MTFNLSRTFKNAFLSDAFGKQQALPQTDREGIAISAKTRPIDQKN